MIFARFKTAEFQLQCVLEKSLSRSKDKNLRKQETPLNIALY